MRNRSPKRASNEKGNHTDHYTRLADDFGFTRRGHYRVSDNGKLMTGSRFWLQPLTLFILSLIALVMVCAVQLWRMGTFDGVFGARSAQIDPSSKRWMLNGRSARTADDRVRNPQEPDIDRGPPDEEEEAAQ